MKLNLRKALSLVLLVVCLFSTVKVAKQFLSKQAGYSAQSSAQQLSQLPVTQPETQPIPEETQPATAPSQKDVPLPDKIWVPAPVEDDPQLEELADIQLDTLRQVNPEVVGWIRIPGTDIDFPLTQAADNTFYLEHTWDLVSSSHGNIFLECRNSPDMTDFNTIIYGHHMGDGTMFAPLRHYAKQAFFEEHPYVYIVTDAGVFRYEVFSSYHAEVESKTYGLSFNQEQTRVDFLQLAMENSQIDTRITPATTDRIITLSTCTGWGYTHRRVVHARLQMIEVYDTQK